jgi:hypothetical protein
MADYRARSWLQFGILDLLILTTVVAVVLLLSMPVERQANKAAPWPIGSWANGHSYVHLYPDGDYSYDFLEYLHVPASDVGPRQVTPILAIHLLP